MERDNVGHNMNIGKIVLTILGILVIVGIAGGYLMLTKNEGNEQQITTLKDVNDAPMETGEPKTEKFVASKVEEYWEAAQFKDYRSEYRLLDNELKSRMTEDEYIRRQEWLDENTLSGVVEIEEAEIGNVTLLEDAAEVRTTLVANTGEFSDITKLVYESGEWHKVFEAYDTLAVDKSFDQFMKENSD